MRQAKEKKPPTYIGKAIAAAMDNEEKSQSAIATSAASCPGITITQSSVSRVLKGTRRPDEATLKALTHCWKNTENNLRILIGHLEDEVHRAGHPRGTIRMNAVDGIGAAGLIDRLISIRTAYPELCASILHLIEAAADEAGIQNAAPVELPARAAESTPARESYSIRKPNKSGLKRAMKNS